MLKLITSETIAIMERLAREIREESGGKKNSMVTYLS
jgi:hypothetical protein